MKAIRIPLFALMTFYDLATDLLLAFSMYPSWTTWFVLGAASIPNVICSATLVAHGFLQARRDHSLRASVLMAVVLFLTTVTTFPLLVALVVMAEVAGWKLRFSGVWRCWSTVNVDRLASLFSGVTACTEDVFISIFTTVGFLIMAQAPWQVNKANIYFASWTFWLGMITAMFHMVVFCNQTVDTVLDGNVFSSVRRVFMNLCDPATSKPTSQGQGQGPPWLGVEGQTQLVAAGPPQLGGAGGQLGMGLARKDVECAELVEVSHVGKGIDTWGMLNPNHV